MASHMLECPNCKKTSDTFLVSGTLVTGEMSVRVGPGGTVLSAGPIKPKTMIKPGHELAGKFVITCPNCQHTARPDTFKPVMLSVLSGQPSYKVMEVNIPGMYVAQLPIAQGEEELFNQTFTPQAALSWDDTGRVLDLLGLAT